MACRRHRRLLGFLPVAALVVAAWAGCKGKGDGDGAATQTQKTAAELDKKCERMGGVCGDKEKHVDKIVEQCKLAAKAQVDKGCTEKAIAMYDCYEKQLCVSADKVWALEDLGVLAERHGKCVAERNAASECEKK